MVLKKINGKQFYELNFNGALVLKEHFEEVDKLNVFPVPDGDTGTNMLRTIQGGLNELINSNEENLGEIGKILTNGMLMSARGNSGVILSQIYRGICESFEGKIEVDALSLLKAYENGVKRAYEAVVPPVEGTIITVFREAVEATSKSINKDSTINDFFEIHFKAAQKALENTPNLLPVLKKANVVDSGGAGYFYIVQGILQYLNGEKLDGTLKEIKTDKCDFLGFTSNDILKFGYCTEFILRLQCSKVDVDNFNQRTIIDELEGPDIAGNSIVCLKDGDMIKVHVHTEEPGIVLHKMRKYGEFLTVKVENMALQHNENINKNEYTEEKKHEYKKYTIVAVASGDGIIKQFEEFGVDVVIGGGQTMNPSTEDFLKAFEKLDTEYIYVFPNNKNIVMTAKQAADMYKNATVKVVSSTSIPQCFSALTMYDFTSDNPETILNNFNESIKSVVSGEITTAIRASKVDDVDIEKDDYIAIVDNKIVFSGNQKNKVIMELLKNVNGINDKYLCTIIFGKDVTEEEKKENLSAIESTYPNLEIVTLDGGQEVYKYFISLE